MKNFGILYNRALNHISFAPTYDVVNTVVYSFQDKPALMMQGKKVWYGKRELIKFGVEHCYLSDSEAEKLFEEALGGRKRMLEELHEYIQRHPSFAIIGHRMLDSFGLDIEQTYKEIPLEIRRNWKAD